MAQAHGLLLAETLLLLFQFAGFLLGLGLCLGFTLGGFLFLSLFLGFLFGGTLGGFLFLGLLLGFVVATLALQLLLNRLVDGLRSLAQSDVGLLVGGWRSHTSLPSSMSLVFS